MTFYQFDYTMERVSILSVASTEQSNTISLQNVVYLDKSLLNGKLYRARKVGLVRLFQEKVLQEKKSMILYNMK